MTRHLEIESPVNAKLQQLGAGIAFGGMSLIGGTGSSKIYQVTGHQRVCQCNTVHQLVSNGLAQKWDDRVIEVFTTSHF